MGREGREREGKDRRGVGREGRERKVDSDAQLEEGRRLAIRPTLDNHLLLVHC